jgi:hypothetical protein
MRGDSSARPLGAFGEFVIRPQKRIASKDAVSVIQENRTDLSAKPASAECLGGFSMRRITQNLRFPTPSTHESGGGSGRIHT